MSAIVRTVDRLLSTFTMTPDFDDVVPLSSQIGGVARSERACRVPYLRAPAGGR